MSDLRGLLGLLILLTAPAGAGENFPLGPLGATAEVQAGWAHAVIVKVQPDGPAARAGLAPGDSITSAAGQSFEAHSPSVNAGGRGPQKGLGEAVDDALRSHESDGAPQVLSLGIEREGEPLELEVELPHRPALSGERASEGRRSLRAAAARQLLASRAGHGAWDSPVGLSGDRVTSAWAVIALLAHGDPDQTEQVDRAVSWLRGPEGRAWLPEDFSKGPDNLGNWALTATAVALAEHDHARGTDEHEELLSHICEGLVARMTDEGRFGHDVTVGYGGKGFNVVNTLSHLAWAAAHRRGVPIDEPACSKSLEEVKRSIDPDHGVRYWTMKDTGTGDASLRTASMAVALQLVGREPALSEGFVGYLSKHAPRTREAHAVGSLGMLLAAPALRGHSREAWESFIEEWRWYLTLMWGHDDRLHYIGGKGNNGGDSYLGMDKIAAVIALQLLSADDGRLMMHHRHSKALGSGPPDEER